MKYSFEIISERITKKCRPHIRKATRYLETKGKVWSIFRDLSEEASYAEFYKYHVSLRIYLSWDLNLGLCINEGEVMSGDTPYLIVALNDIYQQVKETFIVTKPAFSILSLSRTQTIYPCMVGVRFGKAYLGSNFNGQLYYYVGAVSNFDYPSMVALNKAYDMFNAKYGKGNILITDPAWHTVQHGIYEEIPGLGVWVRSAFANDVGNLYVEEFSKFMSQLLSSYPISNYNYLK